jgi:hypothetical protein
LQGVPFFSLFDGKLFSSRVSDPSELPQSNIADFDLNITEENKSATASEVATTEPLSVLSDKGKSIADMP